MASVGKCFLVTGPPGVGKTTLIMRVLEALKQSHPGLKIQGFYTREVRDGVERVGFEVVTLGGRRGPLASTNIASRESQRWPSVGRYKVDVSSFESIALPELQVKEHTDLFVIDEVGKMELFSSSFFACVLRVLESNIPLLASVPAPKSGRDLPGVLRLKNHPGATIYMLNVSDRDAMKEQVLAHLKSMLAAHDATFSHSYLNEGKNLTEMLLMFLVLQQLCSSSFNKDKMLDVSPAMVFKLQSPTPSSFLKDF